MASQKQKQRKIRIMAHEHPDWTHEHQVGAALGYLDWKEKKQQKPQKPKRTKKK